MRAKVHNIEYALQDMESIIQSYLEYQLSQNSQSTPEDATGTMAQLQHLEQLLSNVAYTSGDSGEISD